MAFMENMKRLIMGEDEFDNEDEDITSTWSTASGNPRRTRESSTHKEVKLRTDSQLKVIAYRPQKLEELPEIADTLRAMTTVVLNITEMDQESGRRMLDSLAGVGYMLDSNVVRIAVRTYMFLPYNVEFEGALMDELGRNGLFSNGLSDDDDLDDDDDYDDLDSASGFDN